MNDLTIQRFIQLIQTLTILRFCIATRKGGAHKTTASVHIALGIARLLKRKVALIDLDSQGQCATLLGMDKAGMVHELLINRKTPSECFRETGRENLYLLSGDNSTLEVEKELGANTIVRWLDDAIKTFGAEVVVIDTPPVGIMQEVGLRLGSDGLIIPATMDALSIEGIAYVINLLTTLRLTPDQTLIVPSGYVRSQTDDKYYLDLIQTAYPGKVYGDPIPRRVAVKESISYGITAWEYKDPEIEIVKMRYTQIIEQLLNHKFSTQSNEAQS